MSILRLLPALAAFALPAVALAADPIKIGVIAENSAIAGIAIPNAAQIAADEINAKGGIDGRQIEIVAYDDHNSAADAVRAFQRLSSQDKVSAVIASYTSEVALALEPWSGRLKMPTITPGAASDDISKRVHADYDHLKYFFHGYLASAFLAQAVCDAAKDLLVDSKLHMKTAVIMSEDAAWTGPLDAGYEACLPKIGLKVLDHIRMSPDTTDFTPIYNGIEAKKPDVIITGISHVGVQPTVQWANQQVPIPHVRHLVAGDVHHVLEGHQRRHRRRRAAARRRRHGREHAQDDPVRQAYIKKYGITPAYTGYTTYDEVYYIADAIHRAGGTDPDKMVDALEKTDWQGTVGRVQFFGKDDSFTHAMSYGTRLRERAVRAVAGRQAGADLAGLGRRRQHADFPSFIKLTN